MPDSTSMKAQLLAKIADRSAVTAVIGLGYVGLPLAMEFCEAGFTVIGYDVTQRVVDLLMRGKSHIQDVPSAQLAAHVKSGKFSRRRTRPRSRAPTRSRSPCRRRSRRRATPTCRT